jgi:TolB-like protein/Flp pilus assembly protein TadD
MDVVQPLKGTIRFGAFEADFRSGELRKQGVKVRLQEQPFQILQMLLEHPGEVVTREQLRKRIWPDQTFVDFDQGVYNAMKRLRETLEDAPENPRFIETLARRGYRFIGTISASPRQIESLAVLPLENLSRDPEQEYFADGMTEVLITNLAKISALQVVSRTTAMHYKGIHRPLPELARELGVDGIVEGTVMRSGRRVRISAQLVDAHSDRHLWAEDYDRHLRDVLELQSEVARAIARAIQVKLTLQEQTQLARTRPVDPEAYEAYLKGRYYWNKRSGEGVKKGADYFQPAIEKDPTYAAAYAGLADCAGIAGWWCFVPPEQGCGRAKAVARRALEMEETAEAHTSLGWAILLYDWEFLAAEEEFRRAIELNPRYATAHEWYGLHLVCVGRFDEAWAELKQATELDPLSPIIRVIYSKSLWVGRRNDEALEQAQRAFELDPNFLPSRWNLGYAYDGKGMYDLSIEEFQKAVDLSGGAPTFVFDLGYEYAVAGKKEAARKVLQQLQQLSKTGYLNACWMAVIYAALEEREEAFRWFEKAYHERSPYMPFLKTWPRLENLHSDPRFQDLLRRLNFPS